MHTVFAISGRHIGNQCNQSKAIITINDESRPAPPGNTLSLYFLLSPTQLIHF